MSVILWYVDELLRHIRSENFTELREVKVAILVFVNVSNDGLDLIWFSLYLDALEAISEVIVADESISILIELLEDIKQLDLTIKYLIFDLIN